MLQAPTSPAWASHPPRLENWPSPPSRTSCLDLTSGASLRASRGTRWAGAGKRKGILGSRDILGEGSEAGVSWCLWRRGGRGGWGSGRDQSWGPQVSAFHPVSQVTSYGGELRFTVTQRPQPGSPPLHKQPLVVLQGNGIVLEHHPSQEPSPGQPTTFTVPFWEVSNIVSVAFGGGGGPPVPPSQRCQYPRMSGVVAHVSFPWQQAWQRPDGQPATREHLLMALAGIDTLLIQASYSQQPAESRCLGPGQENRRALGQVASV